MDAKCAKRSVKIWNTTFYKCFFKNISLYISSRLSKIRSVHTYLIPRPGRFILVESVVEPRNSVWQNSAKPRISAHFSIANLEFYQKVTSKIAQNPAIADNCRVTLVCAITRFYCTGWSRKIETVFLSYELSCKEDLKRNVQNHFMKLSFLKKLQNATELLSISCLWMLSDQWKDMRENTVVPHERHTNFKRLHGFANPYFFNFFVSSDLFDIKLQFGSEKSQGS